MFRWRISPLIVLAGCAWRGPVEEEAVSHPDAAATVIPGDPEVVRCVDTVADLQLPAGMAMDDPRLTADHLIVVHKGVRRIQRFYRGRVATLDRSDGQPSCWPIGLGFAPKGHKYREGDGRTPEGWYRTSDKPWSSFYAAIAVHFPNALDVAAGRVQGRIEPPTEQAVLRALERDEKPIQNTALGGEILIHGGGGRSDWTFGCVAMDDAHIDALRSGMPAGMKTDVLILP